MAKRTSKSALLLLELIIIIGVFLVCCGVCLSIFADANEKNRLSLRLSEGSAAAQNVAEIYKANGGDMSVFDANNGETAIIGYDADWNITDDESRFAFTVCITPSDTENGVKSAQLTVWEKDENFYGFKVTALSEGGTE